MALTEYDRALARGRVAVSTYDRERRGGSSVAVAVSAALAPTDPTSERLPHVAGRVAEDVHRALDVFAADVAVRALVRALAEAGAAVRLPNGAGVLS